MKTKSFQKYLEKPVVINRRIGSVCFAMLCFGLILFSYLIVGLLCYSARQIPVKNWAYGLIGFCCLIGGIARTVQILCMLHDPIIELDDFGVCYRSFTNYLLEPFLKVIAWKNIDCIVLESHFFGRKQSRYCLVFLLCDGERIAIPCDDIAIRPSGLYGYFAPYKHIEKKSYITLIWHDLCHYLGRWAIGGGALFLAINLIHDPSESIKPFSVSRHCGCKRVAYKRIY